MGLAPYGEPRYVDTIMHNLIDIKADGTFRLNMDYFDYATGLRMTSEKFNVLFDGGPRQPEMALTQREMDLACSIQRVTEEIVLRLAKTARKETGSSNLCMAGGVALNCVANGQLDKQKVFDKLWIQPAAGDAGSAIGAALCVWHEFLGNERVLTNGSDAMRGSYLGPEYTDDQIKKCLDKYGAVYTALNESQLITQVAQLISQSRVVGWFQGRMEFGPRALGSRSILGDPRDPNMQSVMNLKIKYRESFRPFAPSVLAERAHDIFDLGCASPYMLLVAKVNDDYYLPVEELAVENATGLEKLKIQRSTLPAITHVDYSARIQTVHQETNPRYYRLIGEFERITGCPVLINTSFNVRGEPIVCMPDDAYRCFMRTEMDYLALGNYLLVKKDQPELQEDKDWRNDFELD